MKPQLVVPILATLAALCTTSCGNPEQKIRLRVTDEAGKPLPNVDCMAGFTLNGPDGKWLDTSDNRKSGADGVAELKGETLRCETLVRASAPGCYKSEIYRYLMDLSKGKPGDHWEPWPVELTFVMKRIIRPHPMYFFKSTDDHIIIMPPGGIETEHGYDLLERDWVAPDGKGKIADFRISGQYQTPGDTAQSPKGWVVIRFSNVDDGMIEYAGADSGGSVLRGPHEAPETGFKSEMKFPTWIDDATMKLARAGKWAAPMFVFRIRTVKDKDGKIISARYGKLPAGITGFLDQRRQILDIAYYLNGTNNDRGMEWDMKTNLFKDLGGKFNEFNWGKP